MAAWVREREYTSRDPRVIVRMPVVLETAFGTTVDALIADLSGTGFRLTANAVLHPGQLVTMRLPRETVVCKLCWVDGPEAGGVFQERAKVPTW